MRYIFKNDMSVEDNTGLIPIHQIAIKSGIALVHFGF